MMSLQNYEARIIRGHIMKVLNTAYPYPASLELLELTLGDRSCPVSPASIRGYLLYLQDEGKGYITTKEEKDKALGVTRIMVRLTSRGKDLLEGNIPPDPGVAL